MNQNRNALWIAVIGVVIVILVGYLLTRSGPDATTASTPASSTSTATPAPAEAPPPLGSPNLPPLAPAVPVLPPDPNAKPQ